MFNPFVPDQLTAAAANLFDAVMDGGLADRRPHARRILAEARHRLLFRYVPTSDEYPDKLPVLLVPTLGAPPACFDLRVGNSLVQHYLGGGVPTYQVDFGRQQFSSRDLDLERWVETVLPRTIREVSADAGDRPIHVVGWSLGGVLAALTLANDASLPVRTISLVAAPFDLHRMRLRASLAGLTTMAVVREGPIGTALTGLVRNPLAGPLVRAGLRLVTVPRELRFPATWLLHVDDRQHLAQLEALESVKRDLRTYTGRSIGEIYNRFISVNALEERPPELHGEFLDLGSLRQPCLAIAGHDDILAPEMAVHQIATLLPEAAEVRLRTAPGGHLAVLAGADASRTTWRELDDFQQHWDERRIRRLPAERRISIGEAGVPAEPHQPES